MWKKIWNDPVGSKLISVGAGAIIAFLGTFIYSRFTDKSFDVVFEEIVFYKIQTELYVVILVLTGLLILQSVIRKITMFIRDGKTKKVDPVILSNQLKIKEFINRNHIRKYSDGFTCRFITQKSKYDKLPFIHDLTFFCDLHDIPLRITGDRCPDPNCKNNTRIINKHSEKNNIESYILNDWYSIDFK